MAQIAFDTSTKVLAVALADNNRILVETRVNLDSYTHSEYLMKIIDESVSMAGISNKDLNAIGVVKGPGSFTGLRIGLAVAKGLAVALDLDIYTYTSLEAIAVSQLGAKEKVLTMLPAQRGEVYGGLFDVSKNKPRLLGDYFLGNPLEFAKKLSVKDDSLRVVGEGYLKFKDEVDEILGSKIVNLPMSSHISSAANIVELMSYDTEMQLNKVSALELEPFYMRLSAAEEQRRK